VRAPQRKGFHILSVDLNFLKATEQFGTSSGRNAGGIWCGGGEVGHPVYWIRGGVCSQADTILARHKENWGESLGKETKDDYRGTKQMTPDTLESFLGRVLRGENGEKRCANIKFLTGGDILGRGFEQ